MPTGTLVTVLLLARAHCDAHGALIALHVPITGVVFASASAMSWIAQHQNFRPRFTYPMKMKATNVNYY